MSGDRTSVLSWSGLSGTPLSPHVLSGGSQSTQRVRDGKRVVPPSSNHEGNRKELYLSFIKQLEAALRERARTVESLHETMEIPKSLKALVGQFYVNVIHTIDKTLRQRRSGAPTTLNDARKLVSKVADFEVRLDLELTHDHVLAFDLAVCMRDLCDDVRHYIRQIEITSGVVFVKADKPLISNRPTNWVAKQELAGLLFDFKKVHGDDAWPSAPAMRAALKRRGLECSERSVRNWLLQFKSESASLYVQPKTSRQ